MRVVTWQREEVGVFLENNSYAYRPSWDFVCGDWRQLYKDVCFLMSEKIGKPVDNPPVWGWRFSDYAGMTQDFYQTMFSEYELADLALCIELDIPSCEICYCSYQRWLDYIYLNGKDTNLRLKMRENLLAPDVVSYEDHLQVLFPHIKREWIVGMYPLLGEFKETLR